MFVRKTSRQSGFTLTELMVVVLILGLLAAVAVPAFTRYLKRAKTAEATQDISVIYRAQITYFENQHERTESCTFVNAEPLPASPPSASKYPSDVRLWDRSPSWAALGFSLDRAHYFQYESPGDTTGFTARARGDLDGDGVTSRFERTATLVQGEIQGSPPLFFNELE